jgi:hypothetical protein
MSGPFDEAARKLFGALPDRDRPFRIAPITSVAWEQVGATSTQSLNVYVDVGSGPVRAQASDTFLATALASLTGTSIVGRQAIIASVAGAPTVLALQGYLTQTIPVIS